MDNVIHSPLDNKRIYTKDNFYINAIRPKEKEALLYESMLIDGKGSINDIDAFFVTAPPLRTTLAPKRSGDNDLPDFVQVSEGSVAEEEQMVKERPQRAPSDLKLVKLPPQPASTVAPFKHNSPVRRQLVESVPSQQSQLLQPSPIRFPAQPWQIPPLHLQQSTPNPLTHFFQPIHQPQPVIPPNPFFPQQTIPPTWTPPPLVQPNPIPQPPTRNDSFDPYIPIGIGQPPYQFQQNNQHPAQSVESHRQPLRPHGFARTFGQQPIPLPSSATIDTAFNQAKEREFSIFPPNQIPKKPTPPIDYSVDSVAVVTKDQRPPPLVRSIPEKTSEQLRNFVKVHPHVMNSLQKPLIYRGKEMVIPKMFNFTNAPPPPPTAPTRFPQQPPPPLPTQPTAPQLPPQPVSFISSQQQSTYVPLMNPNQKLDLCCRKQRISPICQNLCNYDTFNDKTLVAAFLTNQCPGPQLGQAYDCASSKADHSSCCERAGLVSFQGGKSVNAKSSLDCDFSEDCCWATTKEEEQWEIQSADELDLNEFKKIFLTGKSRPPPSGNYAIRVENKRKSSLISCAVCSATGQATVKFRHWQSANAMLKICWQLAGDGSPTTENCQVARHSKQSKLNTYKFRDIDKNKNFRLVFIVENADAEMDSGNEATIIVDQISVDYDSCDHAATHEVEGNVTKKRTRHKGKIKCHPREISTKGSKIKENLKKQEEKQAYLKNVDQQIAKVVDEVNAKQAAAAAASSSAKAIVPALPKTPVDPLTDLLGSEFVDFLDPNYESNDEEETDENDFDNKDGKKPSTTTPHSAIPSTQSSLKSGTAGKAIGKRVETSRKSIDTNGQVIHKTLKPVEHLPIRPIPTSESVVKFLPKGKPMQVQAQNGVFSLPSQQHQQFIIFDALEFSMGTRLIACCLADGQLTCPFSTPSEQTGVLWQFSKFECPIKTSKISFICENFGLTESLCAVDNIRIHTSTDVFFLEACQKDKLHRS
uniref:DB domain-containing protein n=1 Tax=Caenorhabditis tropicalis TaxID=1561998 RepID=A0A1I7UBP9_9PELO